MNVPSWVNENKKRGVEAKYPFATMQVGQTHSIPVSEQKGTFASFKIYAYQRGKKLGRKFFTRVNPDNGDWDIWRGS